VSTLRVLSISTLYPNDNTPNFGVFVERQMQAVMARGGVDLVMLNPLGIPHFPFSMHPRYRALARLATEEQRGGVHLLRPHFKSLVGVGARYNPTALAKGLLPLIRRLHAEQPFDLIDVQYFWPDGPAAMRIARELGLPLSIKARGTDVHFFGRKPGYGEQVRAAALAADGILAVSEGLADDIAALFVPREKITIHRTGLNRDVFRPLDRAACRAKLGLPLDRPVLTTVGGLIPRKGQSYVIEALTELPDAILLLAGFGEDRAKLEAFAAAKGVSERVRFLGGVPNAELPVVYSAADICVMPSLSEGLANAWVEALACGTPVVTTPIPGALELLTSPDYGRLAERNSAAIVSAVRDLLANPPARDAVVRGAAGFSWEANAEALVAHWRRLAKR
jgi:teichuronic acid biosynthesis glycosyltransferase TuaC